MSTERKTGAGLAAASGYAANTIRALKTQQRRKQNGECLNCGEPVVDGWRCQKCKLKAAIRSRNYARTKLGIPLNAPLYSRRRHNDKLRHGGE